jgi:hypothetical protein
MRRAIFFIVALTIALAGSASATVWPDACGKENAQFKVKTEKNAAVPIVADPEKATIVFVESTKGPFGTAPTARFGVDGAWVGADHGLSYFVVTVPPGKHHLCASRQSGVQAEKEDVGIAEVSAAAGEVYYYEFKIVRTEVGYRTRGDGGGAGAGGLLPSNPNMTARDLPTIDSVEFTLLNEDEGRNRIKAAPVSKFVAKP